MTTYKISIINDMAPKKRIVTKKTDIPKANEVYEVYELDSEGDLHISRGLTLRATCRVGSSVKANVKKWLDRLVIPHFIYPFMYKLLK